MKTIEHTKTMFKRGEKYHLDSIYDIQGLGGNDWWEVVNEDEDDIIITRNITIEIKVTSP